MAAKKKKKEAPKAPEGAPPIHFITYIGFVVASAVLVYSFVSVAQEGEQRRRCSALCLTRPDYAGAQRKVPSFSLPDLEGNPVTIESYRGKVVFLNFWTKTCNPCLEEMPTIADLARIVADRKDVAVLTVSTDESATDARNTLKSILKEDAPFRTLLDVESSVVRGKFGTKLYPETWLIDKNGVIRMRFDRALDWSEAAMVEIIDQLRKGSYCPVDIDQGEFRGEAARFCEAPP